VFWGCFEYHQWLRLSWKVDEWKPLPVRGRVAMGVSRADPRQLPERKRRGVAAQGEMESVV